MNAFKQDLDKSLRSRTVYKYIHFQNKLFHALDKHALVKKKILTFNNNCFMTKPLRMAIMHRHKLKNIYVINQRRIKIWLAIKSNGIFK